MIGPGQLAIIKPSANRGKFYCEHMGVGKVERYNQATGKVTLWFDAVGERRVFSKESILIQRKPDAEAGVRE